MLKDWFRIFLLRREIFLLSREQGYNNEEIAQRFNIFLLFYAKQRIKIKNSIVVNAN